MFLTREKTWKNLLYLCIAAFISQSDSFPHCLRFPINTQTGYTAVLIYVLVQKENMRIHDIFTHSCIYHPIWVSPSLNEKCDTPYHKNTYSILRLEFWFVPILAIVDSHVTHQTIFRILFTHSIKGYDCVVMKYVAHSFNFHSFLPYGTQYALTSGMYILQAIKWMKRPGDVSKTCMSSSI